jgi:hypothetical protein
MQANRVGGLRYSRTHRLSEQRALDAASARADSLHTLLRRTTTRCRALERAVLLDKSSSSAVANGGAAPGGGGGDRDHDALDETLGQVCKCE